jgi:hypothetical protein
MTTNIYYGYCLIIVCGAAYVFTQIVVMLSSIR